LRIWWRRRGWITEPGGFDSGVGDMWGRMKHAGPSVVAVVALALSIGTLHKERKTRHRVEDLVRERGRLLKQLVHSRESCEVLVYDIEGVRARVEALWEMMEKPKGAASPETARR
jgi:hypothetical protein